MASNELKVSIPKFMAEHVVMRVRATGVRRAMFRLKLAIPLLWFAAKVAGVGLSFDLDNREWFDK